MPKKLELQFYNFLPVSEEYINSWNQTKTNWGAIYRLKAIIKEDAFAMAEFWLEAFSKPKSKGLASRTMWIQYLLTMIGKCEK